MKKVLIGGVPFLKFERVSALRLAQLFTLRKEFFHPGRGEEKAYLQKLLGIDNLSTATQVHGTEWVVVERPLSTPPPADALLTDREGVYLGILVADCIPLLILDRKHRAFALVHAGWRGVAGGIHLEVLRAMETVFGSCRTELVVGIGPAIGGCCFEVRGEVLQLFTGRAPRRVREENGRFLVDLVGVVVDEMVENGVAEKNVERSNLCTVCHAELFHSFRREKEKAGRNMLLAGWRKRD